MKQIVQDLSNGSTILEEVPVPVVRPGAVLIKTTRSLVSLGTERMLVEFGKANLIQKARQQPDRVKQVLEKIKTDGLFPTLDAVFNKLNQPLPLGYCNVGVVIETGKGVTGLKAGDRVASNGCHAEYVVVNENLAIKVPDNVTDDEAAFTVIGSIGLQGIRLCNPTFGETIVVIGLGLIGLITAELLKSNGCRVIGYDFDQSKVDLAKSKNILAFNPSEGNDPVKYVKQITDEIGADGVIITASSKENEIIHLAAEMCRKRGRIILVGVIGLDISRSDFYEKELTFQVSCSYGPGRYDENYEQKGIDYPIGYVRWTEKRNFDSILKAISSGLIDVKPFISERVKLDDYLTVYSDMRKAGSIASIIIYPEDANRSNKIEVAGHSLSKRTPGVLGIIGAGNFTSATIIPILRKIDVDLRYIASASGLTAKTQAKKGKIKFATSDYKEILRDGDVDTVIITTRHDLHAKMIIESLGAGKNVFVEKPLCINENELSDIINEKLRTDCQLIVGFNRRFAPLARKMKNLLGNGEMNIIATMNAGFIPANQWVHDMLTGGGRIIGEACHYIDLCSYLTGSRVKSVCMNALGSNPQINTDNASILLKYENGSNAVINYFANGAKSYSKERIEVFSQGKILILDNWRSLKGYGIRGFSKMQTRQDKGHRNQFEAFVKSVRSGDPVLTFDEIVNTTKASFAALSSLKEGRWINLS